MRFDIYAYRARCALTSNRVRRTDPGLPYPRTLRHRNEPSDFIHPAMQRLLCWSVDSLFPWG